MRNARDEIERDSRDAGEQLSLGLGSDAMRDADDVFLFILCYCY